MSRLLETSSMVAQANEALNSSRWQNIECFFGIKPSTSSAGPPHVDLANLQKDYKSLQHFENQWGPLLPRVAPETHRLDDAVKEKTFNMADGGLDYSFRDTLRKAWGGNANSRQFVQDQVAVYMRAEWKFETGRIRVFPENLWSVICILFLQDHARGRTGVCANPDCQSPYFIKKRKTQKFCEAGPCVAYAQRKYALSWWNRKGKKRREKKSEKGRKSGRIKQ